MTEQPPPAEQPDPQPADWDLSDPTHVCDRYCTFPCPW